MRRHGFHLLLLVILLLAGGLRFYRLDAQSFWNDEGNSARIAERSTGLILEGAAGDIHPPGYYLILHTWRALVGQSEFSLRAPSAFAGVVLVLLAYCLGRRLFSVGVGLSAALLGAVSPFAVYYSQEARMYALLAVLSALATLLMLRLLGFGRRTNRAVGPPVSWRRDWAIVVAYVLAGALGLYTQYTFPFVLLVHNSIFVLWWLAAARHSGDRWRWLGLWVGMQVVVVLLFLPWLDAALASVAGWGGAGREYTLARGALDVLRVLTVGVTFPVEAVTLLLIVSGILVFLGLVLGRAGRTTLLGRASVALWLLLPVALMFAFDLYRPAWLKFLLVILPAFHLLLARGIDGLAQWMGGHVPGLRLGGAGPVHVGVLVLLVFGVVPSLDNLYHDPSYARDDYRQIAADIEAVRREGDAVVLDAPNQWEVFTYYHPDQDVYPTPYRPTPDRVQSFLEPLLGRNQRLFVLYWGEEESDPKRLVERYLAEHAYQAGDRWYGNVRLTVYGIAPLPLEPVERIDARFGEDICLRSYAVPSGSFAPGDVLPVILFWETRAALQEPYKVTIQLLDGSGQLVAQHDGEPGAGLMPTTIWQPDRLELDRHGISIPGALPAGQYTLITGLYHTVSGERLPARVVGEDVRDHVFLTTIEIAD